MQKPGTIMLPTFRTTPSRAFEKTRRASHDPLSTKFPKGSSEKPSTTSQAVYLDFVKNMEADTIK